MLKFLKIDFFFPTNKTLWRKILNLHRILCFLKKLLFHRHLLKFPRYYNSYELLLTIISTKGISFQFFDIKKLIDYQNIISKISWITLKKQKTQKNSDFFLQKMIKFVKKKNHLFWRILILNLSKYSIHLFNWIMFSNLKCTSYLQKGPECSKSCSTNFQNFTRILLKYSKLCKLIICS
jgi:hypothetical protein